MILIAHRGNIVGQNLDRENTPDFINEAIEEGYDVEIDVWVVDGELYLGHDYPETKIEMDWIYSRSSKLWIHCKNLEAVSFMRNRIGLNWFWHQTDKVTLTSKGFLWCYPGVQGEYQLEGSIAVLPTHSDGSLNHCGGICSDYIKKYLEYR